MNINYADILNSLNAQVILITDPYNLRYYTGFRGGEGVAFISDKEKVLITDSRYTEAAKEDIAGYGSDFMVIEFNAANPKYKILAELFLGIDEDIQVAFEDKSLTVADYQALTKGISDAFKKYFSEYEEKLRKQHMGWLPVGDVLDKGRIIKTPEEIELLTEAEHIGDMAFDDILGILKPGMTELEVAAELEYSMKKHGAEGFSFDTIAASGINSSMPHAIPSEKKLASGEFITMDFGCIYKGYCSDMTRTVCIGKADDEMKKVYNIVLSAQLKVLDELRPGMQCCEVDAIARDYIKAQGYGDFFGHGLGHGVGLYIHESPAFNTRDKSIVKPNMIETDEPGIYLPGRFGVRIEDMILITEDGAVPLANSPKELIEL